MTKQEKAIIEIEMAEGAVEMGMIYWAKRHIYCAISHVDGMITEEMRSRIEAVQARME